MRIRSIVSRVMLFNCVLLYSASVLAVPSGCNENTADSAASLKYEPAVYNIINWEGWEPVVSVPLNARVGDILATLQYRALPDVESMGGTRDAGRYIPIANCPNGRIESFVMEHPEVTGAGGGNNIYQTGVDGVGYRAYYPYLRQTTAGPVQHTSSSRTNLSLYYIPGGAARIEFIYTGGEIDTNAVVQGLLAYTVVDGWGKDRLLRYNIQSPMRFQPAPCIFTSNSNMKVTLNDVNPESVNNTPDAKLNTKEFSLVMQCNQRTTPPTVTFMGEQDDSNIPGLMKNQLTGNMAATGVAILLEYLTAGQQTLPADLTGNVTTTDLHSEGSCGESCEQWRLPLMASYLKTTGEIKPGMISSRVEITVEHP